MDDLVDYDEFGNYVGPELDEGDSGDEYDDNEDADKYDDNQMVVQEDEQRNAFENRIVLHEDKKYYPDVDEVYPGVNAITLDEDAQDLSEPIIKPLKPKQFSVLQAELPEMNYCADFMTGLMQSQNNIRNVAVLGHLHHGKTVFIDTLVQSTQKTEWDPVKQTRFTDTRKDEQEREISIKCTAISLVLENLKDKSYLVNILDCPGHVNFCDESTAAIRAADGVVIVVDAVEGVMLSTERLIKSAIHENLPICIVNISYFFFLLYFY
jgi:U5 small nuclear ribonucleoprotein component